MSDYPVLYQRLEPVLFASAKTRIDARDEIPAIFERLRRVCGEAVSGDATVVFHGGAVKEGFIVEAGYPVSYPVEEGEVHTRTLEAIPAFTMLHRGAHSTIRDAILRVYGYFDKHAWTNSLIRREIYRVLDPANPENNLTEVQVLVHEWDRFLAEGAEKLLGLEARRKLMQGIESITPDSSAEDYVAWIEGAMDRLDALTDDPQKKCRLVSGCAHVFPQERIEHLRSIYQNGSIDDVLHEMHQDDAWYEKPARKGNIIYMRKIPYDPEGYEKATTPAERRRAYCHCSFVHPYLDKLPAKLSTTFCFCGAGWYFRLWEGILGQPVKIEHVETLLRGNDQCTLTITLPLELEGECIPENPWITPS